MGHVAHADGVLFVQIGQEGSLVVDFKVKDAVLIRQCKRGAIDGGGIGGSNALQVQAVKGREHGEFELKLV